MVADSLRRLAKLPDPAVRAGPALPDRGLRTTVRAATTRSGRLGFRAARSHRVVPVDACLVAHPRLSELFDAATVHGPEEVTLRTSLATGTRSATWSGRAEADLPSDVDVSPTGWMFENVAGHRFRVSTGSFFQASPQAAAALVTTVRELGGELLAGADRVVDAYSGVGLFAVAAVPASAHVTAVELSSSSTADAVVNLAGRSAEVIRASVDDWSPTTADVVIADPSRAGLGRAASERLASTGAEAILLISCDAAAGARDVGLLMTQGYSARSSVVLDPFPHTPHVEVVTLLTRGCADAPS
ncbi:MAG: hypothetical protein R2715_24415 [Ilumatobacteraceae bacterium]